jgi:hypothetical protein
MTTNIGGLDRALRIIVGVGAIGAAFAGYIGPWGYAGIVPLATALIGWCPAYTLVGMNTCGVKQAS